MAAGVGKRLLGLNKNKPKCLIEIDGVTLIRRTVNFFHERGIKDISIIVGYNAELIKNEIKDDAVYFENPLFSTTNSIMSLWYAKDILKGDVVLLNADLYFESQLLDYILNQTKEVVMLADSTRIEEADYRFGFNGDRICSYGKHLSNQETDGEYVGIARIDKSFIKTFKQTLENMIRANRVNDWWEDVLYSYIPKKMPINYFDVAGTFWTEVDTVRDYNRLQNYIKNSKHGKHRKISRYSNV